MFVFVLCEKHFVGVEALDEYGFALEYWLCRSNALEGGDDTCCFSALRRLRKTREDSRVAHDMRDAKGYKHKEGPSDFPIDNF